MATVVKNKKWTGTGRTHEQLHTDLYGEEHQNNHRLLFVYLCNSYVNNK